MKKLLACLLALAMVLTLVAVLASCGDKNPEKSTDKSTEKPTGAAETEKGSAGETETEKQTDKETEKQTEKATKKETQTKKETVSPILGNPTFDIVKLDKSTITIDGELDEVYYNSQPLELLAKNIPNGTDATGMGAVGDTTLKDEDFADSFYFAYDAQNLYICEVRYDKTPYYPADSFRRPYTGDGSLIWFVNYGKLVGGIQWNAAVNLDDPESDEYSKDPVFGWFKNDDQVNSVKKDWESKREQYTDYYILEVKIPLTDISIKVEDIEADHIGFTFCTVDIVSDQFDGDPAHLWTGNGYQLQYTGVNNWAKAYIGVCKNEPDPSVAAANATLKTKIGSGLGTNFSGVVLGQLTFDPIDISKATKVKITFRLNQDYDLTTLTNDGDIELCAGGGCDQLEIAYHTNLIKGLGISKEGEEATLELNLTIDAVKWTPGTNHTDKPGTLDEATFKEVLSSINFFRCYMGGNVDLAMTITSVVFE